MQMHVEDSFLDEGTGVLESSYLIVSGSIEIFARKRHFLLLDFTPRVNFLRFEIAHVLPGGIPHVAQVDEVHAKCVVLSETGIESLEFPVRVASNSAVVY